MAGHFGGISPVRQHQKAKTLGLIIGLAIIVCVGIVALVVIGSKSKQNPSTIIEVPAQIETVSVIVPIVNVEAGQELKPSMFKKEARPKIGLPPRVIHDFEEIKNHYARSLIASDTVLVADYITELKPSSVITARIPDGYRAVTIRVDAQSAVEGWARPGAKVDVVWATTIRGKSTVSTIVENAEVLSAEQSTDAQGSAGAGKPMAIPSTVTLMITAQDAQKIQLAKTTGTLSLTLRGDSDVKTSGRDVYTVDDLLRTPGDSDGAVQCNGKVKLGGVEYCIRNNGEMVLMDEAKSKDRKFQ